VSLDVMLVINLNCNACLWMFHFISMCFRVLIYSRTSFRFGVGEAGVGL